MKALIVFAVALYCLIGGLSLCGNMMSDNVKDNGKVNSFVCVFLWPACMVGD